MLNKYTTVIVGEHIDLRMETFHECLDLLDPFQTWDRHTCRPAPGVCALQIGGAGSNGQVQEINQYESAAG